MASTGMPSDCFPSLQSLQCLSGTVPDECKAARVACATGPMAKPEPIRSPLSPPNHISPVYANTPGSTNSQAIITSSDSEDSNSGKAPQAERPNPTRPTRPHRRIPHTIIERRYRDNLNTQIETLRLSLPSLKNAYVTSPDVEDSALPPRLPSKAMIIATAATYIKELEAERQQAVDAVSNLQQQVNDLQKLIQCNDCSILQYLQAVGGQQPAIAV
ncbi:hypothetical protein DOTSEDRAFT_72656 [Lecanosticta acicola]|uniref:BHLH domain-containing protein n=1 Tax=Lecanosticta acicola TaxID=111012 RepID=A0AAI8Z7W5_9PEZI|nr:hypothetical protein DOTSEDRAFT_72656 [Lecanosticta acicola]